MPRTVRRFTPAGRMIMAALIATLALLALAGFIFDHGVFGPAGG